MEELVKELLPSPAPSDGWGGSGPAPKRRRNERQLALDELDHHSIGSTRVAAKDHSTDHSTELKAVAAQAAAAAIAGLTAAQAGAVPVPRQDHELERVKEKLHAQELEAAAATGRQALHALQAGLVVAAAAKGAPPPEL